MMETYRKDLDWLKRELERERRDLGVLDHHPVSAYDQDELAAHRRDRSNREARIANLEWRIETVRRKMQAETRAVAS
jgi:hypothetical protein